MAGQVEPREVCIKRPCFQPEIIQRLHREKGTSRSTSQLQHQQVLATCNIKRDWAAHQQQEGTVCLAAP